MVARRPRLTRTSTSSHASSSPSRSACQSDTESVVPCTQPVNVSTAAQLPGMPPAKLLVQALCYAGSWKPPVPPSACVSFPCTASTPGDSNNDDSDDDMEEDSSRRLQRMLKPPAPSGRIAAWLVCRDWRDTLRGCAMHLAAALVAAHGPKQALVRAVRCSSTAIDRLALVQQVLVQCGERLPCLEAPFIEAAQRGHEDIMRLLLQQPCSPALRPDCQDGAALVVAAARGHTHVVSMLLAWPEHAPSANSWDSRGFIAAASEGHDAIVKLLLHHPVNAPRGDVNGGEALEWAIQKGHHKVVRLILCAPHGGMRADADDSWPLVVAARHGRLAIARMLLKWPIGPARADCWGGDALRDAALSGNLEMVKLLLTWPEHAPPADSRGSHQALLEAALKGHLEVVQYLLKFPTNASPANCHDGQVLINAVRSGNKLLVQMLLSWPDNAPKADGEGKASKGAPLAAAAEAGHVEVVRLLLKAGACSGLDKAMAGAARGGHCRVAKVLLQYAEQFGGPHKCFSDNGQNALQAAAEGGHADFILWLVNLPCLYRNVPKVSGLVADTRYLIAAARSGKAEAVRVVLEARSVAGLCPKPAVDALHVAASSGYIEMVQVLLQHLMQRYHANTNIATTTSATRATKAESGKDWRESEALVCAAQRNYADIVRALLAAWPLQPGEPEGNVEARKLKVEAALIGAARLGKMDAARALLEWNHPDAPTADCRGGEALCEAARYGRMEMMRFLLTYPRNAPRADVDDGRALIEALQVGEHDAARLLLDWPQHPPNPNCQNGKALTAAVSGGLITMVEAFLEWPAGPVRADVDNGSALVEAARAGRLQAAQLLLTSAHPPSPNCQDGEALIAAATNGNDDVLELLLGLEGDDVAYADVRDGEALISAARNGQLSTMIMLLTWPHRAPRADVRNGEALFAAIKSRRVDAVRILLDWDQHAPAADVQDGEALVVAVESHVGADVLRLLLQAPGAPRADCQGGKAITRALTPRNAELLQVLLEATPRPDKALLQKMADGCIVPSLSVILHKALMAEA